MWFLLLPAAIAGGPTLSTPTGEEPGDGPGAQAVAGVSTQDIINGESASIDDYPMTGVMLMKANLAFYGSDFDFAQFVCSSTLIAPDVVLLAAHCVDETTFTLGLGTLTVYGMQWTRKADLTEWDGSQSDADWPSDAVEVIDTVFHPGYSYADFKTGLAQNDDIALLFLAEPIEGIAKVYLPTSGDIKQIEEGATVTIVGWGQQEATDLFESPPPGTIALKMQGESTIDKLGEYEMQIGEDTADTRKCHGDSGGPTFLEVDTASSNDLRLIGVTSHAYDDTTDCFKYGGVDTRVDPYLDWIEDEMVSRCDDGTRVWCNTPGILEPPDPSNGDGLVDSDDINLTGGCSAVPSSRPSPAGPLGAVTGGAVLLGLLGLAARRRS